MKTEKNPPQKFSYKLTTDPMKMDNGISMDRATIALLEKLYLDIENNKPGMIEKLQDMIKEHPHIPQFKNYLARAYEVNFEFDKAIELNYRILQEHPNYIYGVLRAASDYIKIGKYPEAEALLGADMKIESLYPHRKFFHPDEIRNYYTTAITYLLAVNNGEAAEARLKILEQLGKNNSFSVNARAHIHEWKLDEATRKIDARLKESRPEFNHPEINMLYENGLYISAETAETILALPRETLLDDLVTILADAAINYKLYSDLASDYDSRTSFPLHAIFLLTELKAEEKLDALLEFLSGDEEFLEFWLYDFLSEDIWQAVFVLGRNQTDKLFEFVCSPGYYLPRSTVASAMLQLALHEPERRQEVIDWHRRAFQYFLAHEDDRGIADPELIAFMIWYMMDLKATELLPVIEPLYEKDLVTTSICGEWPSIAEGMEDAEYKPEKEEITGFIERYEEWRFPINTHTDEEEEEYEDDSYLENDDVPDWENLHDIPAAKTDIAPNLVVHAAPKTGRNDPCPCGSGKKYKKCCGAE